jgi:hypothetical protein
VAWGRGSLWRKSHRSVPGFEKHDVFDLDSDDDILMMMMMMMLMLMIL